MPEGPEIRLAADKIEKAITIEPVQECFFAFANLKQYQAEFQGKQVLQVETRGKALLIHFDHELSIYSHNQLYGRWYVRKAYQYPNTRRQLRLAIHNSKKSALLYSASDIEVLTQEEISTHHFLSKLGPDVLTISAGEIRQRLQSKTYRRRQLASLYLDQHFLAGIGNYLRSEILFIAKLAPTKKPADCSEEQLKALASASISTAYQSYKNNGITNDLKLAKSLKHEGFSRNQYRHWVFGREQQPCHHCGEPIIKITISSRRVYYCSGCQK